MLVTVALEPVMTLPSGRTQAVGHSVLSGVDHRGLRSKKLTVRLRTINVQPQALLTDPHMLLLTAATHRL